MTIFFTDSKVRNTFHTVINSTTGKLNWVTQKSPLRVFNPFASQRHKVILTVESVDEILWCDHSNETSSAVPSHRTIYIYFFYRMKFGNRLEFWLLALLVVKGLPADSMQTRRDFKLAAIFCFMFTLKLFALSVGYWNTVQKLLCLCTIEGKNTGKSIYHRHLSG